MTNEIEKPYRVLTIDGGGIRGLYSATLLNGMTKRLSKKSNNGEELDLGKEFDMIVGTSTGAILAIALAAGIPLSQVINLYRNNAKSIFTNPAPSKKIALLKWLCQQATSSANDPENLQSVLKKVLGNETLEQMYKRRNISVCIPTVDLETQQSWVFKTPHDPINNRLHRDDNYSLTDVCVSSASAPIIFPVHRLKNPNGGLSNENHFIDGGLWANNPVLVGFVEALTVTPPNRKIEVLSVGTCSPYKGQLVKKGSNNMGLLNWWGGMKLLDVSMSSQSFAFNNSSF